MPCGRLERRVDPPSVRHVAQAGVDLHRHEEPVALALGHADRPGERAAQERLDELLVPFEPAGRQHDALASVVAKRRSVLFGDDADDALAVAHQMAAPRFEVNGNLAIDDRLEERPDQPLALSAEVAGGTLLELFGADLVVVVLHAAGEFRQAGLGRVDAARPRPEFVERVGLGVERTTTVLHCPDHVRLVIGKPGEKS